MTLDRARPKDEVDPRGGDGPPPDLEIQQELEFQRRSLRVQHAAWIVMGLVTVAALLGVLGGGPLSGATASTEGLEVGYARFARHRAATDLVVRVDLPESGGDLRVWISRSYADAIDIETITPEPTASSSGPERVTFEFDVDDAAAEGEVTFSLLPVALWRVRGDVGVEGVGEVGFSQVVYP